MAEYPLIRTPMTDMFGFLVNHQYFGRCGVMEMKAMECVEAYGMERAKTKCRVLLDDAGECHTMTKQFKRFNAMRRERDRQIATGQLKGDAKYVNPRIDTW